MRSEALEAGILRVSGAEEMIEVEYSDCWAFLLATFYLSGFAPALGILLAPLEVSTENTYLSSLPAGGLASLSGLQTSRSLVYSARSNSTVSSSAYSGQ